MTRRERIERRMARREEWAASRDRKAQAAGRTAHAILDMIPPGQPILVGHHSEGRHRRDLGRVDSAMRNAVESSNMADHHRSKAAGLANQLDRSIFSDDPDAVEALTARVAELEATRDRRKQVNAIYKRGGMEALAAFDPREAEKAARLFAVCPYHKQPYPSYSLTNIGAEIRRNRKRRDQLQRQRDVRATLAKVEAPALEPPLEESALCGDPDCGDCYTPAPND